MKKIATSFLFLVGFLMSTAFAQNDNDVLLTVGAESVTVGDFLKAYAKNNNVNKATEADLRDYLERYINFRMKVSEGVEMKLDTSRKFKMELLSYQKQSAQQFLVDKEVTDNLVKEASERYTTFLRASHILINCPDGAPAKDTLAAYNKALSIRNEILSGRISFRDAAVMYSEDPSAREMVNPQTNRTHPGNGGDLGYFTVFDLVYPFECAAFNTRVGEISMPIRTQFGYHLIFVADSIPAVDDITVAQIFIADSLAKNGKQLPETEQKLQQALEMLKSGASFKDVVLRYSEEKEVAANGGLQEPFSPNRRQGDFVKAVLSLKVGEVSEPIASQSGWHIVQMLGCDTIELDADALYGIRNRISRDTRSHKSQASFIARLKKEYHYQESGRAKAIKLFLKNMPPEFFQSKESNLEKIKGIEKLQPMASFADVTISAKDFAKFINRFKGVRITQKEFEKFLNERFDVYVQDKIVRYETDHLMEKHPDLRDLVAEFHDGMVLYEVNTLKVWGEAVSDTAGLVAYYNEHQDLFRSEKTGEVQPMNEVRALVITQYQEYLDQIWIQELRKKYNPVVDEKIFNQLISR